MTPAAGIGSIVRADLRLLRRLRHGWLLLLGVVLVPAAYALIYLTSVWNPGARTQALPALIVNHDRGVEHQGRTVRLGDEIVRRLQERPTFGYRLMDDEAAARHAVAVGEAQFALLIAPDFSQRAVPGIEPGAARIVIFTSEGNDYSGSNFAKRFAPELARQVNETLNRERWALVLQKAAGAQVSLDELHVGVGRLLGGARELLRGESQLRQGAGELSKGLGQAGDAAQGLRQGLAQASAQAARSTDGVHRLGQGVRQIQARLPADGEASALLQASDALAQGHVLFGQALVQLHDGAVQLQDGAGRFRSESEGLLLVGERVAAGAGQLQAGAGLLADGLSRAREQHERLSDGSQRLGTGLRSLVEGLQPLGGGLRQLAQAVPPDEELQRLQGGLSSLEGGMASLAGGLQGLGAGAQKLSTGLGQLETGAIELAAGLQALSSSLPAATPMPGGNPGGLAGSVQPVVEVVAPVPANGAGFAPNFLAVALWVGATLCSFVWPLRRLPQSAAQAGAVAQAVGKFCLPAVAAMLQALALLVMLKTLLPVPMPGDALLLATLLLASLAFLAILLALVRLLGEVGKAVALLLLVTQISAGGGTLPVALTTDFHRAIHPFLPFSWVIRALRSAMFGAYEGAWAPTALLLAAAACGALLFAAFLGRWKVVPDDDYRAAADLD